MYKNDVFLSREETIQNYEDRDIEIVKNVNSNLKAIKSFDIQKSTF